MRMLLVSVAAVGMAVDGGAVTGHENLLFEALKQGGLLIVSLILLRNVLKRERDTEAQLQVMTALVSETKLALAANATAAHDKDQQIQSLMEVVAQSHVAMAKMADSNADQARAMDKMTATIEAMRPLITGRRGVGQ